MSDDTLRPLISTIRRAYYTIRKREPIAAVLDTMDALGFETRFGQRPVLSHYHRTPTGWCLMFELPPGIASREVRDKADYFSEQTEGTVTMRALGRTLVMDVYLRPLPERVPYVQPQGGDVPLYLGESATGPVVVGLAKLPHLFVAGQTGAGKTNTLRAVVVAALQAKAQVVIIDLKGLDFAVFERHATVIDEEAPATAILLSLNKEHDRRKHILRRAGCVGIQDYRGEMPYIVLIIDELAELQQKEAQEALNRLLRLARATGICVVAATQRPSYTLYAKFTDSRMLFAGKLCFWMPKPQDSMLILENDAAANLPPDIPGRAIWQYARQVEVQTPLMDVATAKTLLPKEVSLYDQRTKRLPA